MRRLERRVLTAEPGAVVKAPGKERLAMIGLDR
jgi:hypothetical protein